MIPHRDHSLTTAIRTHVYNNTSIFLVLSECTISCKVIISALVSGHSHNSTIISNIETTDSGKGGIFLYYEYAVLYSREQLSLQSCTRYPVVPRTHQAVHRSHVGVPTQHSCTRYAFTNIYILIIISAEEENVWNDASKPSWAKFHGSHFPVPDTAGVCDGL